MQTDAFGRSQLIVAQRICHSILEIFQVEFGIFCFPLSGVWSRYKSSKKESVISIYFAQCKRQTPLNDNDYRRFKHIARGHRHQPSTQVIIQMNPRVQSNLRGKH